MPSFLFTRSLTAGMNVESRIVALANFRGSFLVNRCSGGGGVYGRLHAHGIQPAYILKYAGNYGGKENSCSACDKRRYKRAKGKSGFPMQQRSGALELIAADPDMGSVAAFSFDINCNVRWGARRIRFGGSWMIGRHFVHHHISRLVRLNHSL